MSPRLFKNKVIDTLIRRKNEMIIYQDGNDCVLLVENRIIILETLQHTVIQLAHEGHQGIVRTK